MGRRTDHELALELKRRSALPCECAPGEEVDVSPHPLVRAWVTTPDDPTGCPRHGGPWGGRAAV